MVLGHVMTDTSMPGTSADKMSSHALSVAPVWLNDESGMNPENVSAVDDDDI